MKIQLIIPFLIFNSFTYAQIKSKRGSIKIKKVELDSTFWEKEILDSTKYQVKRHYKKHKSKGFYATLVSNIYFNDKYIICINKDFNLSKNEKSKAYKKLKRKLKNNRLHYFRIKYQLNIVDSLRTDYYSSDKYLNLSNINNKEIKKIIKTDSSINFKKKIGKTKTINTLIYSGDTLINNIGLNQTKESVLLDFLIKDKLILIFKSNKTIYEDYYQLKFNLKDIKEGEVTIIKNDKEEYICNYWVKNKKIFIKNPPIGELSVGKLNSNFSRIKYKIHNMNHIFKH